MKTKTFTFAVMHFVIAFSVAYLITGSVFVGGAVAILEPAINTVAFYFHELWWNKFKSNRSAVKSNRSATEISCALQSAGESYALRSM